MTITLTTPANLLNYVQGSVTAVEEAITLARLMTAGGVACQITGTWAGVISFECSVDGETFVAFAMRPSGALDPDSDVVSTTVVGAWSAPNNGYKAIRARYSTDTSGTPMITLRAVQQRI